MSLFGRPDDESPSLQSTSDAEETDVQDIAESPRRDERLVERDDDLDDLDDLYSDDDGSDVETAPEKKLTEREIRRYRRWYRGEIDTVDAFETTRAGDLGRNLLGFATERRFPLSKGPVGEVKGWAARERWTGARGAWPGAGWTAWPLRGRDVPASEEGFGGVRGGYVGCGGFKRRKVEKPSGEFEEALCDLAISKARGRVGRDSSVEDLGDAESDEDSDSDGFGEGKERNSDGVSEQKEASTKNANVPSAEDSTLVFSADQDRTRNILQPTVRSIMSKVDNLMTGLYHSRMNHRAHRSSVRHDAGNPAPSRPRSSASSEGEKKEALGLRDWSEILGMASLTGWDPEIVGRAAERCSRLFGEGMAFARFDADKTAPDISEYRPDSVPRFTSGEEGEEEGWTLDSLLCPHEDCARHVRKFDLRRRLRWHIKDVHDWDPEVEKRPREIVGGVHVDGFLQPISAQPGWRARDKVKSERRGGKRKKATNPDVDA